MIILPAPCRFAATRKGGKRYASLAGVIPAWAGLRKGLANVAATFCMDAKNWQ
jgi:hypothetical protein